MRPLLILLYCLPLLFNASPLLYSQDEQPPLTEEAVVNAMKVEFPHLRDVQLQILAIRIDQQRAEVDVVMGSTLTTVNFKLVITEAGQFWKLVKDETSTENPSSEQSEPVEEMPEKPAENQQRQQPEQPEQEPTRVPEEIFVTDEEMPVDDSLQAQETPRPRPRLAPPSIPFQDFLRQYLQAVTEGDRAVISEYFFKETDFDWNDVVAEEGVDPRQTFLNRRSDFVYQSEIIHSVLSRATEWNLYSFITSRSSSLERSMLRQIVPRASRYIKEIIVEMVVDNEPARITFEGVTYVGSGWRIGAISNIELPQPVPEN
jgi:hypothetical protein